MRCQPGWDTVLRTEAQARQHAYTPQEAALFLFSETPLPEEVQAEEFELPEVPTVAGLAQE